MACEERGVEKNVTGRKTQIQPGEKRAVAAAARALFLWKYRFPQISFMAQANQIFFPEEMTRYTIKLYGGVSSVGM